MTPTAIPWYKSPVYITLLVTLLTSLSMLFPKAALLLGLGSPEAIQKTAELVLGWVGLGVTGLTAVASAFGLFKRKNSPLQPLTLTQKGADEHPATQAANQAAADAAPLAPASASAAPARAPPAS
jgi:hypothetical protein